MLATSEVANDRWNTPVFYRPGIGIDHCGGRVSRAGHQARRARDMSSEMPRLLVWLLVVLVACASKTAPHPSAHPDPAPGDAQVEGDDGTPPMTNTGVLDEESFAALHRLTGKRAPPARGEMTEVAGARAYLSLPEGATPPLPAVLVIHEWWGLNEHIQHWTDRLAADGYAALAVDLYDGQVATDPDAAMQFMKSVDEARATEILKAAHQWLADDPRVSAKKRGVIGWCFGGGWSLRHAMSTPDLDAAVVYYGRLETDPKTLASIDAPVLGIFGNADTGIPPASVDAFEQAMNKAGKSLELHRYDDAPHAFANPSSDRYVPEAAEDAWSHARTFLAEHLRGE